MRRLIRDRLQETPSPQLVAVAVVLLVVGATVIGALIGGGGEDPGPVPQAGRQSNEERRASFLARIIPPGEESARASAEGGVPRSV
ncbi:MAG: hypothetical protein M3356_01750, partial [Actinomycetota bacterium]|nr:hypothetical protein [Actinomycetota bacterium]